MKNYLVHLRRQLHMYPEIGFDLNKTLGFIREELDKMGVEYTEKYGKSSIVATVNPEKTGFTIGVRADIDALPITEENDLPYKSKIDGQMHACGHDAHAAIALDTCRRLNEMKEQINCRVKFLFQAAEEYPPSGAKLMAEDGVMEDIDCIVALHVATDFDAGDIAVSDGAINATSDGFYLEFYGKAAHVANQQAGVDAIMMAVRAYTDIEFMIAKEIGAREPVIFNVGAIHGGVTNNIISDKCSMYCTLRTQKEENAEYILGKIKKIIKTVAETAGGEARFVESKHYPIVNNHPAVTAKIRESAARVLGAEHVFSRGIQRMGGEDFSYFTREKPGCMFNLGVRNEEKGYVVAVHNGKFMIEESGLEAGVNVFLQFILDNMDGIDF